MKKILFIIMMMLPIVIACTNKSKESSKAKEAEIIDVAQQFMDTLIEKCPNYRGNSIAQKDYLEQIEHYIDSYVGKDFPFMNTLPVYFERIDEVKGDSATAWFSTPDTKKHYLNDWHLSYWLQVNMTKNGASKLATGIRYLVKGTLQKWDKKGHLFGEDFHVNSKSGTTYLGTFYMNNVKITREPQK